ncbi:MAG: serine carboxypeptidase [Proteobacteria bacterium]|nr:MAG: serine carboxypeptidase [Pseudomonadota bacterium]
MKHIVVIDLGHGEHIEHVELLGQPIEIHRIGCGADAALARSIVYLNDGKVDAIGLQDLPTTLELGDTRVPHALAAGLRGAARRTPVVDGSGVRAGLERWGVILADRAQPGMLSQKRVLMVPGLNHGGLAQALTRRHCELRYADGAVLDVASWRSGLAAMTLALPPSMGLSAQSVLEGFGRTLSHLADAPFEQLHPQPGATPTPAITGAFEWADVIAGDIGAVRRFAPEDLRHKTVVVEWADEGDLDDLRARGATIAVTMMPPLTSGEQLGRWSAATVEAVLAAMRPEGKPLTEDTYLELLAELEWSPAVRYLDREEAQINRFAFVIHPLHIGFIHQHKQFRWTKHLPDRVVENISAHMPPMYISRIRGAQSPKTGQKIEGLLLSLGATPRQMMARDPHFTYKKLEQCARAAERYGARIMGLGAFTSVVGDAGVTVAHNSDIAITSGNSLTVAATLEAAKRAAIESGFQDLTRGKVMVVGATGSIGSVCSRLLAQAIKDVVLVSIEPERLLELKRVIQEETPDATVTIATKAHEHLPECDVVVTATSAMGERIIDISRCKAGAIICDVARPPDIGPEEAALRPDVLVIESGEILIPGDIDFGYDIGLPPKVSYACLAETALLAMDGRFEDYTLGRDISMDRVKEIYRLAIKHGFKLAGLRTHGGYVTPEQHAERRALVAQYRDDPELFERVRQQAAARLAKLPPSSKGVHRGGSSPLKKVGEATERLSHFARFVEHELRGRVGRTFTVAKDGANAGVHELTHQGQRLLSSFMHYARDLLS